MKHSKLITNSLQLAVLLLATGWTCTLSAFTYTNSNLLLVFREGNPFNDVEFNIGSVSNFLGRPNGTVITVNNWDVNLVRANFNNSLANVKFILLAVSEANDSPKRAWLTDANQTDVPTDITGSAWSKLYSKISYVGAQAAAATFTNSSSQVYVTNASDASSYTQIASSGDQDVTTLSGASPFPVEGIIPATNRFIELKASSVIPKPVATVVGTFAITSAGVLTFTAGPPQVTPTASHIVSIARSGTQNSVTFSTVSGANYRLRYSTDLTPTGASWTVLPTSVAGNGSNQTLTDTTGAAQRFYLVETY